MTGKGKYLDECRKWCDRMIGYQEKMTPKGAYYMNYGRKPGQKKGNWYVADSSSIAMGILATSVRAETPQEKQRYLNSVKSFARLVMDNFVGDTGGIRNGAWPKHDGEWWCSTGTFGSLAFLLHDETGDQRYLDVALGSLDWLNRRPMHEIEIYPLEDMGPTMPMYLLEAYAAAMPKLKAGTDRHNAAMAQWTVALNWMSKHQASQGGRHKYDYRTHQWGSKFGGLPFYMYVYARCVPGSEQVRSAADAELHHLGKLLLSEKGYRAPKKQTLSQLAAFSMFSYAERLSPGTMYRASQ